MEYLGPHGRFIDSCMAVHINALRREGYNTLACCCGHGKYPETVIVGFRDKAIEIYSMTTIPRTRRFYKKDEDGYYYLPEVP